MRKNDPNELENKHFFRTNDRFFQINGHWYFSAREGDIGPFRNRDQAHREALAYIRARHAALGRKEGRKEGQDAFPQAPQHRHIPTTLPGHVYRSVLSLQQQVSTDRDLVLEIED